uniref:KISS1 receptor b n=2 Tax=Danio rerio TaxID=7955 RepID=F1QZU4_DANRE|nr:KISS1 receptor b isoform X1 [Danio rerio]|eukprot:XP_005168713.1 KISS1 receptor b isoform X1 [Danio rerio]
MAETNSTGDAAEHIMCNYDANIYQCNQTDLMRFQNPVPLTDTWLVPLFFTLIMFVGLVGNLIVIYVVIKNQQMKTVTNLYIVNLATTDILFLVCCVPFTATVYVLPSWIFGDFMCRLVNYLQQVTAQATCITLSAMSVDRFYVTVYPLQSLHHRTPQMALSVCTTIWICSSLLSVPIALYQHTESSYWFGPQTYCTETFPSVIHKRVYLLYSFLAVYLLPLITICMCYTFMLKRMAQATVQPVQGCNQISLQTSSERAEAVRSRVSRMVVVMVLLFLLCWGPIQILILLQAFCAEDVSRSYTLYKLKIWAHGMSYSNSSINPVIYAFMGANFRKAFRSVCPLIFKRRSTEPLATYNREMNFLSS